MITYISSCVALLLIAILHTFNLITSKSSTRD